HDQPATLVVDITDRNLQQPEEGLLHHVFGRSDVAEHTKGEVHQIGTMSPPRIAHLIVLSLARHVPSRRAAPAGIHEVKDAIAQPNVTHTSVTFRAAVPSFQTPVQTIEPKGSEKNEPDPHTHRRRCPA